MFQLFMPAGAGYFAEEGVAARYDAYIDVSIPFYRATLERIAGHVVRRLGKAAPGALVELGCGTANLSREVMRRTSRFTEALLLDHSPSMLQVAREKLGDRDRSGLPIRYHLGSLQDPGWANQLEPRSCTAILAMLTLDHIAADGEFAGLLTNVEQRLRRDGLFVLAEKIATQDGPSRAVFEAMVEVRHRHLVEQRLMTTAQAARWRQHLLEEDHLRSLPHLVRLIEASGMRVLFAEGVALPKARSRMTAETFFQASEPVALSADQLSDESLACAIAVLGCAVR
ncbi:MAG: tRNA (cmo5U34)-methyltransferase [Phycisphaerae bacterium]|nr:tRNA (cmo5U34)-methyltransferase [Phycisphaerae bacterium]